MDLFFSEIRSRALPQTVHKSVRSIFRAPKSMKKVRSEQSLAEYSINIKSSTEYRNYFLC